MTTWNHTDPSTLKICSSLFQSTLTNYPWEQYINIHYFILFGTIAITLKKFSCKTSKSKTNKNILKNKRTQTNRLPIPFRELADYVWPLRDLFDCILPIRELADFRFCLQQNYENKNAHTQFLINFLRWNYWNFNMWIIIC